MNDKQLDQLKHIAPSPAHKQAKRRAIQAGLAAYVSADQVPNAKISQGFSIWQRPIPSFIPQLWSFVMNKQKISAIAVACLLTLTLTILFWQQERSAPEIPEQIVIAQQKKESAVGDAVVTSKPAVEGKPAKDKTGTRQPSRERLRQVYDGLREEEVSVDMISPFPVELNRDRFDKHQSNPVQQVSQNPVSTFSIDVDTSSYAFVRRALNNGRLPDRQTVRVEEMINYFDYHYPAAEDAQHPFKPTVAVYPTPWNAATKLLHIGIQGYDIMAAERPHANLVFLLDVSGSMQSQDKLPLLKNAFRVLVDSLQPQDNVAIVTYAGHAGTVLEPTAVKEKAKILAALDQLQAGGSTAGAQGIKQAYALVEQNFDKHGVNRVILATDGDFNVGITDHDTLQSFVEQKRDSGIYLSILGFGQGNYNDALMQKLAQNGNGNAAYIDTLNEAHKVLVEEASSTLFPIAKDVKIQIEFNPKMVSEYRLIGYESRLLKQEDFNNDKIDAGEIGSGHSVTAIYEIIPVGSSAQLIDDLRYQQGRTNESTESTESNEYAFLKIRYKQPEANQSQLITLPVTPALEKDDIADISQDMRFAASVAAFGQLLRKESYLQDFNYDDVIELAKNARGEDEFGYRNEFISLVRLAKLARGEM